jgi:hypothetical protein
MPGMQQSGISLFIEKKRPLKTFFIAAVSSHSDMGVPGNFIG